MARLVVVSLSRYGRLGESAKVVARETGVPLRTVYRALHRLADIGEVTRTPAGWASTPVLHDLTADPTAILGFQNLRFRVEGWRASWQNLSVPPCRTARPWHAVDGGKAGPSEGTELTWEGRRVLLRYYPEPDVLEVQIAAIVPIPLVQAGKLYGWLDAMLGLDRVRARLTFIEVNSDHGNVRLEENYMELRHLPDTALVIYQKARALREEVRLATPRAEDGKPLPLERALALLVEGSPQARADRMLRDELDLARTNLKLRETELALALAKQAEEHAAGTAPIRHGKTQGPTDVGTGS